MLAPEAPAFRMVFPISECSADRNTTAVVAANRAVRDGAAASDTATGKVSIVPAKSAVSERYAARDPAAATPRLAIMLAISAVAADRAVRDGQRPGVSDATANEIDLITRDRAVGNRQRPVIGDAAAGTHRELNGYTSGVVAYDAVSDRHCANVVVYAAALASTKGKTVVSRGVAINGAVHDRHCRAAAV